LKLFNLLNHAKNYADYSAAIVNLHTPGQNCVFACKDGDIAIRAQGEFPAKWKGQGDFVMPGTDSSYMWQGMIPQDEVPFQYIPAKDSLSRGFVSSANQKPTDTTYPYYLGRDYPMYRGLLINRRLSAMNNITVDDMMSLQTDNYNIFAEMAMPIFLKNIEQDSLTADEKKYFDILKSWNLVNDVNTKGATVFEILWNKFYHVVYDDEYDNAPDVIMKPYESTLLESVLKDSSYKFLDDISTTKKETLRDDATTAFKNACIDLTKVESDGKLEWAKYKGTGINFLARTLTPFSRLNLLVGGGTYCINAAKVDHGPSWRMIVNLTPQTEAYGIYPGGQSGNPGSKYFDDYVDTWVAGKYNVLWMMAKNETTDKRIKWKMSFSN